MKMLTKEQRREICYKNLIKAREKNPYNNKALKPTDAINDSEIKEMMTPNVQVNRANLTLRGLRRYLRAYLDNVKSIRDFDRWRIKAPGDALTWAHKVVYGDTPAGAGVATATQVNLLIQVLTGVSATDRSQKTEPQEVVVSELTPQSIVILPAESQKPEIPLGTIEASGVSVRPLLPAE